jgi:hypothetical protein
MSPEPGGGGLRTEVVMADRIKILPRALIGLLILVTAAAVASPARAETYYVDFVDGDDSADGLSEQTAWMHCPGDPSAADNPAAAALLPGDVVRFKGGVVYRGSVTIDWDGTADAPIVFDGGIDGSWGTGSAVMDGSDPVTGWTPCASQAECGNNPNWQEIHVSTLPDSITPFIANLCAGDVLLHLAQEPDLPDPFFHDDIYNFFAIPHTQMTRTSITDPAQFNQADPNHWDGSYVLIWHIPNLVSLARITGFVPAENRVTFDDIGSDLYDDRDELYSIYNSIHALDQPGEYWVSDVPEVDGTFAVYLWPLTPGPIGDGDITVSVRKFGFNLAGHSYITFEGFHIKKYSGDGLTQGVGIGTVTNRVDIAGITVRNNLVNLNRNPERGYGGIFVDACADCLVEDNVVEENPVSRGIFTPGAVNTVVRNNRIWKAGASALTCYGCTDTQLIGNEIIDCTGTHANGITLYLGCDNILVDGNRVINSNICLTMQASSNLTLVNNVFYGGGAGYLVANWADMSGTNRILNNTILNSENNSSVYLGDEGDLFEVRNNILDGGGGGDRSHNIYTSLAWNQDPQYGWELAEGEMVVEDLYELFVDPAALDFHLNPAGPAVDTGTTVDVSTDADGVPRPSGNGFDIGAYEVPGLTIENTLLADGIAGEPYFETLTAHGGTPPYQWSIETGVLPDGLSLDTATGAITGMPERAQNETFTVLLTDDNGLTARREFWITIRSPDGSDAGCSCSSSPAPVLPGLFVVLLLSILLFCSPARPPRRP